MNQVCLIGRLGQDPELRYTQGGTAVAKFSIAINRIGGPDKVTDWFDITAFGKVAESLSNHMRKGCRVGISGRLQQEKWQDKQTGQNRSKISVIAERCDFIDWPDDIGGADEPSVDPDTFGANTDIPGW